MKELKESQAYGTPIIAMVICTFLSLVSYASDPLYQKTMYNKGLERWLGG